MAVHDRIGYTPTQARRLKERIDRQVAKIEDAVLDLGRIVPDVSTHAIPGYDPEGFLDGAREAGEQLKERVDRRTRGRH
jgi:hypothetical protein